MQTTGKNQARNGSKTSITVRLDSFDRKCLELLALKNGYTVSKQIGLMVSAMTSQIKAIYNERDIDQAIEELRHR